MVEKKGLNKVQTSAIILAILICSKGAGFVREILFAGFFGASDLTDAYNVSANLPEIVTGFIFLGITGAYIPMLAEYKTKNSLLEREYTKKVIKLISIVSIVIFVLAYFFSDKALEILAPSWFLEGRTEAISLAKYFIKLTFLAQIFFCFFTIFENYHIQKNRFAIFSALRALPNVFIILFMVIAHYQNGALIIFGKVSGYFIIALIATVLFLKDKEQKKPKEKVEKEWLKKTLILAVPIFISTAVNKINIAVDTAISTGLGEGAPTYLNYGFIIKDMVPSLFVGTILYMLYPLMSKAYFSKSIEKCKFYFNNGILSIFIFLFPVSLIYISFSTEIIAIIYERGNFSDQLTLAVDGTLVGYAIGIVFITISTLIIQTFQGFKKTHIPLIVSCIMVGANIVLSIVLSRRFGASGVALATSLAQIIAATLLMIFFYKTQKEIFLGLKGIVKKIGIIIISSIIGTTAAKVCYILISSSFIKENIYLPRAIYFFIAVILGGGIYLLLLKLFKIEELKFIKLLRKKEKE